MQPQFQTLYSVQFASTELVSLSSWSTKMIRYKLLKGYFFKKGFFLKNFNFFKLYSFFKSFKLVFKFVYNPLNKTVNATYVPFANQLSLRIIFFKNFLKTHKTFKWQLVDMNILFEILNSFKSTILKSLVS